MRQIVKIVKIVKFVGLLNKNHEWTDKNLQACLSKNRIVKLQEIIKFLVLYD